MTPSLCEGWRVRDVAAHLTHSHMAPVKAMVEAVKSGFRFDPMIRRLAIEDPRSQAEIVAALRGMVGFPPEGPDVHRPRPTDGHPGAQPGHHGAIGHRSSDAKRCCRRSGKPFVAHDVFRCSPARRLQGVRLVATDTDFAVGQGREVRAPIRDVVMILAGRQQP